MSPPIRDGSGSSIGSIRLGDGSEISEVRTGAGDVLFSAIPDSDLTQYTIEDSDGGGITATESSLDWTNALGNNNEDRVYREIDATPLTNSFDLVIDSGIQSNSDNFISGFSVTNTLLSSDDPFIGMFVAEDDNSTDFYITTEPYKGGQYAAQSGVTSIRGLSLGTTYSVTLDVDFDSGSLTVTVDGTNATQSFDETLDWSYHQVIATGSDQGFVSPGENSGTLSNHSFSQL